MTWIPKGHIGTVMGAGVFGGVATVIGAPVATEVFDDSPHPDKDNNVVFAMFGGMLACVPVGFGVGAMANGYNGAKILVAAANMRRHIPRSVPPEYAALRQETIQKTWGLVTGRTPLIGSIDNARAGEVISKIEFLRMARDSARESGARW